MRIELLEQRKHYVVPVTMLAVGVVDGSLGPVFYSATEIARSVPYWDGRPVVVYHPDQGANTPGVHNQSKVGVIFNTRFRSDKLIAEAWIDIERVGLVDSRVRNAIIQNQKMEVSTGVAVDNDGIPGTHILDHYIGSASNLRPDHLAILPSGQGACSVADGCGLLAAQNSAVTPLGMPVLNFDSKEKCKCNKEESQYAWGYSREIPSGVITPLGLPVLEW